MNPVKNIGSRKVLPATSHLYQRFIIPANSEIKLSEIDPCETLEFTREVSQEITKANAERISELQRILCATEKHSLLIVLQSVNASGKDGTIRHLMSKATPQGCKVTSFKAPTEEERRHDYLWRVHEHIPPKGTIGIFHRSHYEDVLVPQVKGLLSRSEIELRYRQINDFEKMLVENGVQIVKFLLHISKKEQWRRLMRRLELAEKRHKFNPADLEDQLNWNKQMKAYEDTIKHCSTLWAPYFVIPGDYKWFRNLVASQIVINTLEGMNLQYPDHSIEISDVKIKKLLHGTGVKH